MIRSPSDGILGNGQYQTGGRMGASRKLLATAAGAVAIITIASPTHAAQLTANWNGTTGQWTDATRWSTGVVPNNGANTYIVNIDNANPSASNATFNTSFGTVTTVDSLAIDSAD